MSIFESHLAYCRCGERLNLRIARSVNASRMPEVRDEILRGDFQRFACARCGELGVAESTFYYSDFDRQTVYRVAPRGDRYTWRESSQALRDAVEELRRVPGGLGDRPITVRVVFGLDELREKLVTSNARLDDLDVELLKVLLLQLHPVLRRRPRLRLSLVEVRERHLIFRASYEHHRDRYEIRVSRAQAAELLRSPGAPLHRRITNVSLPSMNTDDDAAGAEGNDRGAGPVLASESAPPSAPAADAAADYWVNIWRWSPQPGGLAELKKLAERADRMQREDFESAQLERLLQSLPPGDHMPSWAKSALQQLMNRAEALGAEDAQRLLTNKRFDLVLADDWSRNEDKGDIGRIWRQLEKLPPVHVEGLTNIREMASGDADGTFDPVSNDIRINSALLTSPTRFERVLRHEVGHSVHEANKQCIDDGLHDLFGWQEFDPAITRECEEWLDAVMDGAKLAADDMVLVQQTLKTLVGPGDQFGSGPEPDLPAEHPWMQADFRPRKVFECMSGEYFKNPERWLRSTDGTKAFFLNYFYRRLSVVSTSALDLAVRIDSRVAPMSPREFFAELYAACFDPVAKAKLDSTTVDWLNRCAKLPTT